MSKKAQNKKNSNARSDREFVLSRAATLFRKNGFEKTTVKEVAEACNMLPGSLHYRYSTKDALLVDLMTFGLSKMTSEVLEAGLAHTNPREQMRECINAHLRVLISDSDMVYVLLFEWSSLQGDARTELIELRDRYEQLWTAMLNLLSQNGFIREDVDINLLRLIGLGSLNWVATWFKSEDDYTLEEVGDFIWNLIMNGIQGPKLLS